MSLPDELDDRLNTPVEAAHEFVVDLNCLVITNHKLTMEGIERAERADAAPLEAALKDENDYDVASSVLRDSENFYNDLRVAARNLTAVALVTRLQHWVSLYARRIQPQRKRGKSLEKEFEFLGAELGSEPDDEDSLIKLRDLRDSVIHADSQASWKGRQNEPRQVASCYAVGSHVGLTEDDLAEAISKAIALIKRYEEKLAARYK